MILIINDRELWKVIVNCFSVMLCSYTSFPKIAVIKNTHTIGGTRNSRLNYQRFLLPLNSSINDCFLCYWACVTNGRRIVRSAEKITTFFISLSSPACDVTKVFVHLIMITFYLWVMGLSIKQTGFVASSSNSRWLIPLILLGY